MSGNARPVRALVLLGAVASVLMGASVTTAFGDGGLTFAIPLGVILALGLFTMLAGLPSDSEVTASLARYAIPNWVAIVLMVVGGALDREPRIVLWILAMLSVIYGTVRAGDSQWLVRPGHFAERHGLIIIVALGEVIVATGIPVVDALEEGDGVQVRTLVALLASGVFACLLWWSYFDRVNPALEHRHGHLDSGQISGQFARDVYTYLHLPIVGGIILAAAGLEEATLHPSAHLPEAFRWMLFGGIALSLGGVAVAVWRAYRVLAKERLVAAAVLAVVALASGSISALSLLLVIDLVLLATLAAEHVRIEGPRSQATS